MFREKEIFPRHLEPSTAYKQEENFMDMNKTLVAYFSCTGTTRRAAQALAAAVDADVYEIRPQDVYKRQSVSIVIAFTVWPGYCSTPSVL